VLDVLHDMLFPLAFRRGSMNALSQRIGLMVMAAATTFGLAVATAPAASAATVTAAPAAVAAAPWLSRWCKPAHTGRDWRWDDGRRGGHWDKREWNRSQRRMVWTHQWRDDRYCAPPVRNGRPGDGPGRNDGPPNGSPGRGGPR
jgi:hypothetical protein